MLREQEVLIDRETEQFTNVDHDFCLLDGVYTQLAFQVLIKFDKIGGIAGVLDDNVDHLLRHCFIRNWSCFDCSSLRCFNDGFSCRCCCLNHWRRSRDGNLSTLHALDIANHMVQGWMFCKNEGFVHWQVEVLANIDHDFCLLDRINTKFTFKILIKFYKISGITCVLDDHIDHRLNHISARYYGRSHRSRCRFGLDWFRFRR